MKSGLEGSFAKLELSSFFFSHFILAVILSYAIDQGINVHCFSKKKEYF